MSSALAGRRIVNTRALHQAAALDLLLRERGAIPVSYPCIAIAPPIDLEVFDHTLGELAGGRFDWLALTSVNAVHVVGSRMRLLDLALPDACRIAAVGTSTSALVQDLFGRAATCTTEEQGGFALGQSMPVAAGERVLIPGSEIARPELAAALAARGAQVLPVIAYRTIIGSGAVDLVHMLDIDSADAIVFTSPSTVQGLIDRLSREGGNVDRARRLPAVCLGETTLDTARAGGFTRLWIAGAQTMEGLVQSLEIALASVQQGGGQ